MTSTNVSSEDSLSQGTDDIAAASADPQRGPNRRLVLVGAVALVLIIVGLLVVQPWSDDSAPADPVALTPDTDSTLDLPEGEGPVPPGSGAETPEQAVEGFLAAEEAGDLEASFPFLDAEARQAYRTPAGWISVHADVLAPVEGYEVGASTVEDGQAEVVSDVQFTPGLDEVVGLVPARATVTWSVVEGEDGWGVDLESSLMEPVYPSDESAPDAVVAWAEARQQCEVAGEWEGTLIGAPSSADALCDANGAVAVGEPEPLSEIESSPFTAAFGGDVVSWARAIPVTAPVELRVVVAPVGDEWQVIGVIP